MTQKQNAVGRREMLTLLLISLWTVLMIVSNQIPLQELFFRAGSSTTKVRTPMDERTMGTNRSNTTVASSLIEGGHQELGQSKFLDESRNKSIKSVRGGARLSREERDDWLRSENGSTSERRRKYVNKYGVPLPRENSLIHRENQTIIGDVQFLLDICLIGFPKTGTTALTKWLQNHTQVDMHGDEIDALIQDEPVRLVTKLYDMYNRRARPGKHLMGFKHPGMLFKPQAMHYLKEYWPKTKLIVLTRHPILFFESFWNFIKFDLHQWNMPQSTHAPDGDAGMMKRFPLGYFTKDWTKLNTGHSQFHVFLSLLGKTRQNQDGKEWSLLHDFFAPNEVDLFLPAPRLPHKVFFVEHNQLGDKNATRTLQFKNDLQDFLGLDKPFDDGPIARIRPRSRSNSVDNRDREGALDVCNSRHQSLREELMRISKAASLWIRQYFLKSPDVFVSNRPFVEEQLQFWMDDPCSSEIDDSFE